MVKIKYENYQIIFYDFEHPNEKIEFKLEQVTDAVCIFENALDKLNRFNRTHEGWEHIQWIGLHSLIPDELKEEGIKIINEIKGLMDERIFNLFVEKGFKKEEEREEYLKAGETEVCEGKGDPE